MALSDDLIAQFAKITKDKQERVKEATVYGKIVIQNEKKFVMIDGSNTLTPVVSTSEANEGERVTVMIKDHTATITGNISNPSSSSGTVGKLAEDYSDVDSRVTDMEEVLSGDLNLSELKNIINNKADKSSVEAISKRMNTVEGEMSDVSKEMEEVSKSMAKIAGDVKDKADAKDVEGLTVKMEEIYPMVKEHEKILSEGGGPDDPETPSEPIHLSAETATVENGFIKNDMIDAVDAGKIKSGTIDNSLVGIEDTQDIITIKNGTITIKNPATGKVVAVLGYIAEGVGQYGYIFNDSDGNAILDHTGLRQNIEDKTFDATVDTVSSEYYANEKEIEDTNPTVNDYIHFLEQKIQELTTRLNNAGIE